LAAPDFRSRIVDLTIRQTLPAGLRAAGEVNPKHRETLLSAAERCEQDGTSDALEHARQSARAAADDTEDVSDLVATGDDAAYAYVTHLAYVTASADSIACALETIDEDVIEAATLAGYAAYYAALAGSVMTDRPALSVALARDRVLADYVDGIVGVLVEMRTPGSAWVH
jgi:hypothetical protein